MDCVFRIIGIPKSEFSGSQRRGMKGEGKSGKGAGEGTVPNNYTKIFWGIE